MDINHKALKNLSSAIGLLLKEQSTMTISQAMLLVEIMSGETHCSELRKIIRVPGGTLSRMINRLGCGDHRQKGLELIRSFRGITSDQRYIGVALTPKGEEIAAKLKQIWL